MGTVPPDELARLWRQEQLTVEMAIGQLTQHIVQLHGAVAAQRQLLHAALEQQRQLLLTLQATLPVTSLPTPPTRKQRRRK